MRTRSAWLFLYITAPREVRGALLSDAGILRPESSDAPRPNLRQGTFPGVGSDALAFSSTDGIREHSQIKTCWTVSDEVCLNHFHAFSPTRFPFLNLAALRWSEAPRRAQRGDEQGAAVCVPSRTRARRGPTRAPYRWKATPNSGLRASLVAKTIEEALHSC